MGGIVFITFLRRPLPLAGALLFPLVIAEPLARSLPAYMGAEVEESTWGSTGYPYASVPVFDKSKDRENFVRKLRDDV